MAVSAIVEVIVAIAQVGLAGAACVGVWVAWRQLSFQRKEKDTERRIAIASEVLEVVHYVQGCLVRARLPLSYGPLSFEQDQRTFIQNRLSELDEIGEKVSRLQVLVEYVDFRFHILNSSEDEGFLASEIKGYVFECNQVILAFQYLLAKAPFDSNSVLVGEQDTWKEQFDIAISSEEDEDITGHNLHTLSRRIINGMSRVFREGR